MSTNRKSSNTQIACANVTLTFSIMFQTVLFRQCDQIWRKFSTFVKILKFFGISWNVNLIFDILLALLWQIFYPIWQIFIHINSQKIKYNEPIWSHVCSKCNLNQLFKVSDDSDFGLKDIESRQHRIQQNWHFLWSIP